MMLRRAASRLPINQIVNQSSTTVGRLSTLSFINSTTSTSSSSLTSYNNNFYTNNNNVRNYCQKNKVEDEDMPEALSSIQGEDSIIEETEKVVGVADKHSFQTETQKILHIVAESLYTEKEVFIRELISNASDAIEKARHLQLTSQKIMDGDLPFEIKIATDDDKKTLIIQDTGVGMTKEELIKNLGRIGYSGTGDFLKNLGDNPDKASVIGQFGVGFYSCFMVGHTIKVYSRSAAVGSKGYLWESDGAGSYSISEADGVQRGTKIIIHLKPNSYEFAKKATVEAIIKKYSNFVGFPIALNGQAVNTIKALWTLNKSQVTDEEHKEFYQFISKSYDTPNYKIHFATDTPLTIRSIFYIPSQHVEKYGMGRMEPGVSLFSRKVLIQQKAKGLLPDWMRFVRGVVDSEDIPLNVSREHLQDNGLIQRISQVLVKRILKTLDDESKRDPAKFNVFMNEFAGFFKEGLITDFKWKDDISRLLRFESSHEDLEADNKNTSLEEYTKRMKPDQNQIFYITVPSREVALSSPYYEPFKNKGVEVFFLYNTLDDFVFSNIGHFGDKKIVSVESKEAEEFISKDQEKLKDTLSQSEVSDFLKWITDVCGDKVSMAKATTRNTSTPALIVDHESATFRRMMKMMDPSKQHDIPKQQVEFNMNHSIVLKLHAQRQINPAIAKLVAEQIVDNALVTAGLYEDSRTMVPRLNSILDNLLTQSQQHVNK
ncbi:heat shock protein Hsp90 family protein [Cavenderia fasciculata]|uniref:Heat shock protein Hsp90 family protein n=1 Tax=Cavenderia fasciculata TaxID=261658 RepID=F4QB05_CACFS|nr:heat shock protein Hsp90 family protein [Cavenderia fasciculata]EGG14777.1 heat shock protein Hsp90 family protein [Cavenderia fasciculata]|eukprot:XP_004351293.1 heat shock protein Hsp90 family protein [Cavenderia fasciculata]